MLPPLTLSGWLRYDLVRRRLRGLPITSVLEIGPGAGALGALLAREYDYLGVEIDHESAALASKTLASTGRGRIVHGTPAEISGTFDLVCAFEVLEHIEDDAAALLDWRERIQPGGWLALSVPAGPGRWGAHDERAGHFRRYERHQLLALLDRTGFGESEIASYGFPLLTALHPMWNVLSARAPQARTLDARTRGSGRVRQPPPWTAAATKIVAAPFARLQRPFTGTNLGTGYVVLAAKA